MSRAVASAIPSRSPNSSAATVLRTGLGLLGLLGTFAAALTVIGVATEARLFRCAKVPAVVSAWVWAVGTWRSSVLTAAACARYWARASAVVSELSAVAKALATAAAFEGLRLLAVMLTRYEFGSIATVTLERSWLMLSGLFRARLTAATTSFLVTCGAATAASCSGVCPLT